MENLCVWQDHLKEENLDCNWSGFHKPGNFPQSKVKNKGIRTEAQSIKSVDFIIKCLTVTVVPQELRLKLNRALALSVSMGTQLGSNRVVRLGLVGGLVWVVSTSATIFPSGKHTVRDTLRVSRLLWWLNITGTDFEVSTVYPVVL